MELAGRAPARWYCFADGYLGLTADDAEFAARFDLVYTECKCDPPLGGSVVSYVCHVHNEPGREAVVLDPPPLATDAALIGRLLHDQGYAPAGSRWQGPAGWPGVALRDGMIAVERDGPWQWLVAHLLVNVILALQPEFLFFHAAAMAIGERGVLLMGEAGSGKTSVSLALAARGHGFLSDEVGALRLATGQLVPLRRSALVRVAPGAATPLPPGARAVADTGPDRGERVCVAVSQAFPNAHARTVPLRAVIRLRRFATTRLEPLQFGAGSPGALTPLACCVAGSDAGRRMVRLLALLADVPGYALDAASPEEGAALVERTLSP